MSKDTEPKSKPTTDNELLRAIWEEAKKQTETLEKQRKSNQNSRWINTGIVAATCIYAGVSFYQATQDNNGGLETNYNPDDYEASAIHSVLPSNANSSISALYIGPDKEHDNIPGHTHQQGGGDIKWIEGTKSAANGVQENDERPEINAF